MKVVIYLLGFACIAGCTYVNLYPRQSIDAMKSMFRNYALRYLAAIPAVIAILFLISAPASKCPWAFWLVGILAAIEAVVAFFNPKQFYSKMVDWLFTNVPEPVYRFLAIVGVIFGTLIMTLPK